MIQKNLKNWKENRRLPEELGPTITKAEFECAFNQLKSKKAYRVYNIPAELLQALDEETKRTVCCFINNMYSSGKHSDDFKKNMIVI